MDNNGTAIQKLRGFRVEGRTPKLGCYLVVRLGLEGKFDMKSQGPHPLPANAVLALLSTLLLFAALASASDPPWKGKPYQQWDDKDVQRVFTDSPWARTVTITRTWLPVTSKDVPNESIAGRGKGIPSTPDRAADNAIGGEVEIYVSWASSRVMRAASARKAILHGSKTDVDVEKYANEPQEEYQIVLQSEDMAPFFRHDEKFFQTMAALEMKKSKQKISPSHVHFEHDEKGLMVTSATFYFPKQTPSGTPTISGDEKSVEFSCKIEDSVLRVSFEPPKMGDGKGPTL
jgi:hypothetical protein